MESAAETRKLLDRLLSEQQRWWGLEVTGWTVLCFSAIPAVFIFVGLRSGSWFWLWATAVLGVIGMALTGVSTRKRSQAEAEFRRIGQQQRRRLVADETRPEREAA